jgi:hypothetical protein
VLDACLSSRLPDAFVAPAASLGFLVNVMAYCVISMSGPITQKVLGTVKNVSLVVYAVAFLGEHVSWRQGLGYSTSLLGFVWYQCIKLAHTPQVSSRLVDGKNMHVKHSSSTVQVQEPRAQNGRRAKRD